MLHRIRYAQHTGSVNKMTGTVEADETFIGGKARNMHAGKRADKIKGRGPMGKAIVFGLLDHKTGKVHASHVHSRRKHEPSTDHSRTRCAWRRELHTDALESYNGLDEYTHKVVDHAEAYVQEQCSHQPDGEFLSLLKRAIQRDLR